MSLRALCSAAADLVRALLCPVPGPGYPVPAHVLPLGTGRGPDVHGTGYPGPLAPRATRPVPGSACAPYTGITRLAHMIRAGASHETRAWRASPRARLAVTTQPVAPMHTPHVERTPDPVYVTNTGPGVPTVDVLHERAIRTDEARFPRINVDPTYPRPLVARGDFGLPYNRPLAILKIVDDTRVEISGRTLTRIDRYHFVVDAWAYEDGDLDVIVACERSHKGASRWIDAFGGYK